VRVRSRLRLREDGYLRPGITGSHATHVVDSFGLSGWMTAAAQRSGHTKIIHRYLRYLEVGLVDMAGLAACRPTRRYLIVLILCVHPELAVPLYTSKIPTYLRGIQYTMPTTIKVRRVYRQPGEPFYQSLQVN
jgi:hypothetical protein